MASRNPKVVRNDIGEFIESRLKDDEINFTMDTFTKGFLVDFHNGL